MKRLFTVALTTAMVLSLAGCGSTAADTTASTSDSSAAETSVAADASTEASVEETVANAADTEKGEGVMTYADFAAADTDSEVTVETYVQAKQGWWEDNGQGQASIYTQDADGGYFFYNLPCTEDEYNLLTEGTKIKATGYKSEWSGEIEITDATYEIEDGSYIADPVDLSADLGSDDLINYQNMKFAAKGLTVEASGDDNAAFLYNYDGSGAEGDALYFNVSDGTNTYSFTVESYLCDKDSDVYKAVEALNVGDKIDTEGFLYWYEGANPHITSVTVE